MSEPFKVLMIGGPRTGKTSLLAGLFESFLHGDVSKIISAEDISPQNYDAENSEKSLGECIENTVRLLKKYNGSSKSILVDGSKTKTIWDYKLKITIPNTDKYMELIFTDMNGEFYKNGEKRTQQINNYIAEYDAFIIALDTPSLMESNNPHNSLCPDYVNDALNRVDDIRCFLTEMKNDVPKSVFFVPTKCEKWAMDDKLEDVADRVAVLFENIIQHFVKMQNIEVCILPVQTIGNIVFDEHLPAKTAYVKNRKIRCSPLLNGNIRLENGDIINAGDAYGIEIDADAILCSSIMRPNAWYRVVGENFKPHNCEQLAFYILNFMFNRALASKRDKETRNEGGSIKDLAKIALGAVIYLVGGIWALGGWIAYKFFTKQFGTIKFEEMEKVIKQIKDKGLIKNHSEGIRIIKESEFVFKSK